ncbi:LamG-like jellyroll fold domain-containing protein [Neolewinella persica]|uniref:LamG-like jellyroll fold domain-containing protein n=1 Tax=Neolewinella persica TaxID=70998 RepID=UPI00037316CA|nr:LamG-like jellyroll fold domain-containing protein [Neolewinella persica]
MHLPIKKLSSVNSLTHEGKVIVFVTTESTGDHPQTGKPFTFGKVYYTVRQDGFEDNTDRTAMVGWKYWSLLPFIDEKPDVSVREKERENNDLIRSRYLRSGSIGAVAQVQVVSLRETIYVFRIHRETGNVLVDRFILNGLTNELMPKLEVRYKRSRRKYTANAKMKIVNGRLEGVDSLDFRDANEWAFSEPTKELSFLPRPGNGQFAVTTLPTADKDADRWHVFLPGRDENEQEFVRAVAFRSDRHGEFQLDDELVVEPAKDENARPLVRSVPAVIERRFLLDNPLADGLAVTVYNLQTEQATEVGPQLLKGATRLLLAYNTQDERTAALSFGVSPDGLLSLIDAQADGHDELRAAKRQEIFLPIRHLEEVQALGPAMPLPNGKVKAISRGERDQTIVHTKDAHGLNRFDRVELNGKKSFNGHYLVRKLGDNQFSLEQNWEDAELGEWQLLPEDPEKGLAFEGLITSIEQEGNEIRFTTALDHGLENELEVLIKNHQALAGEFEIKPVDKHSFLIATDWDPVQVINLFVEAARRKGLVFDGVNDAAFVEDVLLDSVRQDTSFGHTYSCWVKPDASRLREEQLLLAEAGGALTLTLQNGHPVVNIKLPEGHFTLSDPNPVPGDSWTNLAVVMERSEAYGPLQLRLYRNATLVPAEQHRKDDPSQSFATFSDQGLRFKEGGGEARFYLTQKQPIPNADFTIEAWLRPATVAENRPIWQSIMYDRSGPVKIRTFGALSIRHGGCLSMHIGLLQKDGSALQVEAVSRADLQKEEWSHLAVIGRFAEGGNTIQFIINGQAEVPVSIADGHPVWDNASHSLAHSKPKVGLFLDRPRYYEGEIGQFRIWSRALGLKRILHLAQVPSLPGTKGLLFDFLNWPKKRVTGDLSGEHLQYFGEVETCGSPIQDYGISGELASKAFATYQQPNWSGNFHFGGLAPTRALSLRGAERFSTAEGRSLPMQVSRKNFTFTTWLSTKTGGVLWSVGDVKDGQGQYIALQNEGITLGDYSSKEVRIIPAQQLFDGEWHLLSIRYEHPSDQSQDAVVIVFINGAQYAISSVKTFTLEGATGLQIGGLLHGAAVNSEGSNDIEASNIELAHLRFWSYLRTNEQIASELHHLPSGAESGLAAYWPLDNDKLRDLSAQKLNLTGDTDPTLVERPTQVFGSIGGLRGTLAEVRIWNTALSTEYQKSSLFLPLIGKEYRLAGNWRMGAIWEQDRRFTDFSNFGNDGHVFGDVYLSPDSLRRRLGPTPTAPLATMYRHDDLVAVSARAVYEESMEFRLLDNDRKPIRSKQAAAKAFCFALRGKTGRSARDWVGSDAFNPQIVSQVIGEAIDEQAGKNNKNFGWFRAVCRFVIPDGVALFRVFGMDKVVGDWHWMEIRRHRLTHISHAVSRVTYEDSYKELPTIGQGPTDTRASRVMIRLRKNQIVSHRERLVQLEEWIWEAEENKQTLQDQINEKKLTWDNELKKQQEAQAKLDSLHQQKNVLLSYRFRIKARHSGKYLSLPREISTYNPIEGKGFSAVTQQDFDKVSFLQEFKLVQVDEKHFNILLAEGETAYYLSAIVSIQTIIRNRLKDGQVHSGTDSLVTGKSTSLFVLRSKNLGFEKFEKKDAFFWMWKPLSGLKQPVNSRFQGPITGQKNY